MKETKKRILSIALAFGMVLTMAGVSSVAIGISGARNAQTVANGDQNAIGDDVNLNANDIQPLVAENSRGLNTSATPTPGWTDQYVKWGDFQATPGTERAYNITLDTPFESTKSGYWATSTTFFLQNPNSASGLTRGVVQEAGSIVGKSLKFTFPNVVTTDNNFALCHEFASGSANNVPSGSEAITFKIRTDKPVSIVGWAIDLGGNNPSYTAPAIDVPGSPNVQTVTINYNEMAGPGGSNATATLNKYHSYRFKISTSEANTVMYLDDFMFTKQNGYQPVVPFEQTAITKGGFEESDSVYHSAPSDTNNGWSTSGIANRSTEKVISGTQSLKIIDNAGFGIDDTGSFPSVKRAYSASNGYIRKDAEGITFQAYAPTSGNAGVDFVRSEVYFRVATGAHYYGTFAIPVDDKIHNVTVKFKDLARGENGVEKAIDYPGLYNSRVQVDFVYYGTGKLVYMDNLTLTFDTGYTTEPVRNKYLKVTSEDTAKGTVTGTDIKTLNSSATVTATAAANNKFNGWYEGANLVSTDPTYTFNVTKDRELVAKFVAIPTFAVTATPVPAAGGTITGAGNFAYTSDASLTATPASGYKFAGWADSTGKILSTDPTYNFVVTEATTLTAKFVTETYVVIYKDNDGRIISTQGVTQGSNATPPPAPTREGYEFTGWSSNGQNITADTIITAIYTRTAKRTITVTNGTISEQGYPVNQYLIGTLITVTANAPTAGNKFSHWEDASHNKLSTDNAYQFVVATNITLTAVYVADTEVIVKKPFITLDSTAITNTSTGVITFNAQKHMTDTGYIFKECGMIFYKGTVTGDLTLETVGMKKAKSSQQLELTGQFQMFFKPTAAGQYSARAYMIFTDNTTGNIFTVYSDNTLTVTKS